MTNTHLIYLFYISISLIGINTFLVFIKKAKLTKWLALPIILSLLGSYIGSYFVSGHLPVYDKFATLQNINLILLLLYFFNRTRKTTKLNLSAIWPIALIIQLLVFTNPLNLSGDYYMYDKFYVILFFQMRISSMGIFLYALVNVLSSFFNTDNLKDSLIYRSRNYTLLGAIVFLIGEFSGSYWCLLWWGDSWHWSKGFLTASVMFLMSMLASHLPFNLSNTRLKKQILNLLALSLILTFYLLPH